MSKDIESVIVDKAKSYFSDARPTHDWAHVERVHALALHIGRVEGARLDILSYAALLHDIGRRYEEADISVCHARKGASLARDILAGIGMDAEIIDAVVHCVRTHRFRDGEEPSSLEARVLFDADKLDAIGAIGVARAYAYAGEHNQLLVTPFDEAHYRGLAVDHSSHSPVKEYYVKLSKLKDRMLTAEGRRMAVERDAFMRTYYHRLSQESRGEL